MPNPPTYTPELAIALAAAVARGRSLRELNREQPFHVPETRQLARWYRGTYARGFHLAMATAQFIRMTFPDSEEYDGVRDSLLEHAFEAWERELYRQAMRALPSSVRDAEPVRVYKRERRKLLRLRR